MSIENRFCSRLAKLACLAFIGAGLGFWNSGTLKADPLNSAHIPNDAKWLIYVDFEAFDESNLAKHFREDHSNVAKFFRQWLQKEYGIDPRDDLRDVTMFSDTFEARSGAAIDLDRMDQHHRAFPILSQHEKVIKYAGERDTTVLEHVEMHADSEEVAKKVTKVMEGYVAVIDLWAGESDSLRQVAGDVTVKQNGKTVMVDWESDADTTVDALEEISKRIRAFRNDH